MSKLLQWSGLVAVAILLVLMIGPFQGVEQASGMSDKLLHAAAFGVITAAALVNLRDWSRVQVVTVVFLLGIGVEVVQGMTGRDMDMKDAVADLVGVVVVASAWFRRQLI